MAQGLHTPFGTFRCPRSRTAHAVPALFLPTTHRVHAESAAALVRSAPKRALGIFRSLHATKAQMGAPLLRSVAVAQLGTHPLLKASAPASPAVPPGRRGLGWKGKRSESVIDPLPHIADDVVQSEYVRRVGLYLARPANVLPASPALGRFVAPGVLQVARSPTGKKLPFRLGGQAGRALRAIRLGLMPIDTIDRVVVAIVDPGVAETALSLGRSALPALFASEIAAHCDFGFIDAQIGHFRLEARAVFGRSARRIGAHKQTSAGHAPSAWGARGCGGAGGRRRGGRPWCGRGLASRWRRRTRRGCCARRRSHRGLRLALRVARQQQQQ